MESTHFSEALVQTSTRSLQANILHLKSGSYLTAGRNQFKTLWTRDFCLASRGLLLMGEAEVVRSHLTVLLNARRKTDSLVPRVLDSMPTKWRVVRFFLAKIFPWLNPDLPLEDPLIPEYRDEHGSEAIDSNLLFLLAALELTRVSQDQGWWKANEAALVEVYRFYDAKKNGQHSFIEQAPFSDWQDSTNREGYTFYTNLLYFVVSERLSAHTAFGIDRDQLPALKKSLESEFLDLTSGLFFSIAGKKQISVDGNLLAIDLGFYPAQSDSANRLYQNLKQHSLWRGEAGAPGSVTVPTYPRAWKTFAVKIAGLQAYHDRIYWSWLMGLAAKVSLLQNDLIEAEKILKLLHRLTTRDGAVAEVFSPNPDLPIWESKLFRAEMPFSWGAAFILDAARSFQGRISKP